MAVTDAAGMVVERAQFHDFGRQTGGGAQPHGFQGRYRDAETAWVYFRSRFYDPETGRFLSRDRVWDEANLANLYIACGNGVLSRRDPLGLAPEDEAALQALWREINEVMSRYIRESNELNRLMQKEENVARKLAERASEYREDPLGLPEATPGDKMLPSQSKRGHRMLMNQQKAQLATLRGEIMTARDSARASGSRLSSLLARLPKRGRYGVAAALVVGGLLLATGSAEGAQCTVARIAIPTTYDAAMNRGERGFEYTGEAGWDVLKAVDVIGITDVGEEFLDYETGAKKASFVNALNKLLSSAVASNHASTMSQKGSAAAEFWGAMIQKFRE